MIRKRFARLSAVRWLTGATALLLFFSVSAANALTLGLSSIAGGEIKFDGTTDTFQFVPTSGGSFSIDTSDGTGDAVGLQGIMTGTFSIGKISETVTPAGKIQTASVTGSGQLTIFGGLENLTAKLVFDDIFTLGTTGGIQTGGGANLTSISYLGSNPDLLALAAAPAATETITFQFTNPAMSLKELTKDGEVNMASYSGTISAVPIPPAAWLFGSALLGILGLGHRRMQASATA